MTDAATTEDVDLLGIGFGPANLALAIAIEDHNADAADTERIDAAFVEAQPKFGWHDGMLLPGATMQVSFLKDLATQRSPQSKYTFVNYLAAAGRLTEFINLKTHFPTRREFRAYLGWAAEQQRAVVHFGTRAVAIDRADDRFVITTSPAVRTSGRATRRIRARHVAIATGIEPVLPPGVQPGPRVFHNHRLLSSIERVPSFDHQRFLVIGSGQSAAEVAEYLHSRYHDAQVHVSIRRFGLLPSDDTPYANQIFDPGSVDEFYTAPPELKRRLLDDHKLTNYSAVDGELITGLYRREQEERVAGARRLFFHRTTELADLQEDRRGVRALLRDIGGRGSIPLDVDAVVCATGFRPHPVRDLLGDSLDHRAAFTGEEPIVDRDYGLRLPADAGLSGRIFLNGGVEHSHGLSSSLLSNLAVRADEIRRAISLGQGSQKDSAGLSESFAGA